MGERENIEAVRHMFEGFLHAGADRFEERLRSAGPEELTSIFPAYHPDIEWDASETPAEDLSEVVHGLDAVRSWWLRWLEAWAGMRFEYELEAAGDEVVATIHQEQRGRASGIEVKFPRYQQVFTFWEGKVVHWRVVFPEGSIGGG